MKVYVIDLRKYKVNNNLPIEFLKQVNKYKNEKSKVSLVAWSFLEEILRKEYLINTSELVIELNEKGKPKFRNSDIYFNISHSHNLISIGIGKEELGIDIECCIDRTNFEQLIRRIDKEITIFTKEMFYDLWTKKEARYKRDNNCNFFNLIMQDLKEILTFTVFDSEKNEYKLSIDTSETIVNMDEYL